MGMSHSQLELEKRIDYFRLCVFHALDFAQKTHEDVAGFGEGVLF